MRICIPIEFRPEGGGFYFLDHFASYLGEIGWDVTADLKGEYQVLFTNHWMTPYRNIMQAIRRNPSVRIVQRIDGAAQNYGRDAEADLRQGRVNRIADLTIFQSEYARYSTRELFPVISQDGPVIHNPVDLKMFSPEGDRQEFHGKTRVACVTWSTNPYKGKKHVYEVAERNPAIDFVLCGSFEDAPRLKNILRLGVLDRADLASALRSCQFMLTFSRNEACPNHVLEALACGLPVLFEDSGAMREVIGDCGLPVTVDSFARQVEALRPNLAGLSKAARQRARDLFAPQKKFGQYVEAIKGALDRRPRVASVWRSLLAWSYPARQGLGLA
ncbi:MAG: glycosyltransferase family 4 protein [Anaerolineales bacterium]